MSERINKPRDEAQYRRRTGPPLVGCDCMQCFGYCLVNADIRDREIADRKPAVIASNRRAPLNFDLIHDGEGE